MNKDVCYLLLKTQKEMYERKIKEQADTILSYKAENVLKEWKSQNGQYNTYEGVCLLHLRNIEKMINDKADKKLILKILDIKYNTRRYAYGPGGNYYEMNKNIVALFCDGLSEIPNNEVKKHLKKIVKKLYHYIGKDFASHKDVDTIVHL